MRKRLHSFFLILCLAACGHVGEEHAKVIELVRSNDMAAARQLAQSDEFFTDSQSLLVRYLELGTLYYMNGEYYQALQNFDKAKELSDRLYTTSVSKSVASQIVGDGVSDYAGEKYELSLLRFYQSMTHYRLYEQGMYEAYTITDKNGQTKEVPEKKLSESEKRLHFNAARASILDWNSLLTTFTNEAGNEKTFKQDMLAKAWGAEIHDIYGSSGDRQIARQLYRDMDRLLDTLYKDYPAYQGTQGKQLKAYAKAKGADLFADKAKKENVKVVLKAGLITPKKAEKINFNIPVETFLASGSGNNLISCLGYILPGQNISFEIPSVAEPPAEKSFTLEITGKNGTVAAKKEMVLTAPVSQTAYKEFQNSRTAIISGKTARLTTKYVAAVIAACAVYDENSPWTVLAAYGTFAASSKLIEASEYADVRYWGLLPSAVYQQSARLKKGKYTALLKSKGELVYQQSFEVKDSQPVVLDITLPTL